MNILLFFVGGASAGWVTYKIYHVFFAVKAENNEAFEESETTATTQNTVKSTKEKEAQKTETKTKSTKKKTSTETKKSKQTENSIDDLSKLKGVGPKLTEALKELGIYNYKQLYTPSIDELLIRLKETGGKFTRPVISAVVERAKLADEH